MDRIYPKEHAQNSDLGSCILRVIVDGCLDIHSPIFSLIGALEISADCDKVVTHFDRVSKLISIKSWFGRDHIMQSEVPNNTNNHACTLRVIVVHVLDACSPIFSSIGALEIATDRDKVVTHS